MARKANPQDAIRRLRKYFAQGGYVRGYPNRKKQPETHRGYEIRFSASTAKERDEISSLLRAAGYDAGAPFRSGRAWRIPVYGREAVEKLLRAFRQPVPK